MLRGNDSDGGADGAEEGAADAAADRAVVDDEVVRFTSDLIRIDTTNRGDGACRERPAAEYVAERLAEAGLDPLILESAPGRANVVARVGGADPLAPALLVHGHLDVVPADPDQWTVHPFAGEVRDGMVWGRGAIDMKNADATMVALARSWARTGRRPHRDIVLAFTADEEGTGAYGAEWLAREHAGLFEGCTEGVSESGAYTFHTRTERGGPARLYPIGAGERGSAWLTLTAGGTAGHGAKVNHDNAVGALAAAVARIQEHRWPVRLTPVTRAAITEIGAALGIKVDLDAADFDADRDLDALLDRFGPAAKLVRATVRNSTNPTMLQAGYKVNVIPETATAGVDGRVLPGAEEDFRATLDDLTGPRVEWDYHHRSVPLVSPVESPTYAAMRTALLAHDPDAHVVPVCLSGGTDAKQFSVLGITGYGFTPLRLPPELDYGALFHGVDERVPVDALRFGARVMDRFLTTVE
ncbi:acetylornithine deacetylase/succinyl-diaminopimelate desuccinylase-like protein [Nocardiopsis mwathae]|uniref:Acetylornithine deacetylase/succinyl-diaminopimelate desuccinylase-like protein n=1 Tax=Nocardiopsis mwathae TaxID=1472723 RepID=A0A7X0D6D1_9ACTN|nr:M20/M25/M40 family metallo-hydrolase [Nocardiopsis mwathae]MBB6172611.1 acetylornithine deacetylase/succinyl-diaminopimelate desuccinylase-like protein [Nocardiopsis mwathae]